MSEPEQENSNITEFQKKYSDEDECVVCHQSAEKGEVNGVPVCFDCYVSLKYAEFLKSEK